MVALVRQLSHGDSQPCPKCINGAISCRHLSSARMSQTQSTELVQLNNSRYNMLQISATPKIPLAPAVLWKTHSRPCEEASSHCNAIHPRHLQRKERTAATSPSRWT
mmetsp:Transcript_43604/g.102504  ORF Transcript_43604/g.102504 Transcript_43604/m.102504 type:complete len:107 (-) Transcript_43604:767-1087(-)